MIVKPNELSMTGGSTDQRSNVDSTQSSYRRRKQSSLIKTNNKKNPPRGVVSFRRKARMVVCITVFDKKRRWSLNSCLLPQKNGTRLSSGGPERRTTVWGGPLTSCPASVGFAFALDSLCRLVAFRSFLTPASLPLTPLDPNNTFSSALAQNDPF